MFCTILYVIYMKAIYANLYDRLAPYNYSPYICINIKAEVWVNKFKIVDVFIMSLDIIFDTYSNQ